MEAEAAALRVMLTKLDELEELMNDAAYTEEGEKRVSSIRRFFVNQLYDVERSLYVLAGLPEEKRDQRKEWLYSP